MTLAEIQEKTKAFLVDELEIDEEKIVPEASLREDLGIDSLEVVDVVVLVEQEFGLKMKPEDFKVIKTYGDFCGFILEKVA
ncbi:MAG: acyl carrier protein [Bacteroidales bacterium]|nr:acyl carrier protein [Bacteroidales bacterium]